MKINKDEFIWRSGWECSDQVFDSQQDAYNDAVNNGRRKFSILHPTYLELADSVCVNYNEKECWSNSLLTTTSLDSSRYKYYKLFLRAHSLPYTDIPYVFDWDNPQAQKELDAFLVSFAEKWFERDDDVPLWHPIVDDDTLVARVHIK